MTIQKLMSQGVGGDLLPVAAIDISAGEPALQVVQDESIAKVNGSVIRYR